MKIRVERLHGLDDLVAHDAASFDIDSLGNVLIFGEDENGSNYLLGAVSSNKWISVYEEEDDETVMEPA